MNRVHIYLLDLNFPLDYGDAGQARLRDMFLWPYPRCQIQKRLS